MYLEYDVRDYFEKIVSLKDKRVCDWGCNHGNLINYHPVDFTYTGVDVDLKLIQAMTIKEPYHKWIHFDYYNHQYNNQNTKNSWPDVGAQDLYLLYSVLTHMDVETMKEHINYFDADIYATFFDSTNRDLLKYILGYRLDSSIADKVYNKDISYVIKLKDDILIINDTEKIPRMSNAQYMLTFYSPNYISQYGQVEHIEKNYESGMLSTEPCMYISK